MGSKVRIASRVVDLLPAHRGYVEPYAGSLSILLAKPPTTLEVANDLDGDLVTFWRVLRDRPDELTRACALTPHARAEHDACWPLPAGLDDLERARRVWVKLSQGRGGSLRATGWRHFEGSRGRSASMPQTLQGYAARILDVAERLASVTLECRPALDVIDRYGRAGDTLLYVDPPYLYRTRSRTARYRHELGDDQSHRDLAAALHACRSAVVVSGYADPMYDELYDGWHRATLPASTSQLAGPRRARVEVLWSNRPLGHGQLELAGGAL